MPSNQAKLLPWGFPASFEFYEFYEFFVATPPCCGVVNPKICDPAIVGVVEISG
jgi:hypothetical protein